MIKLDPSIDIKSPDDKVSLPYLPHRIARQQSSFGAALDSPHYAPSDFETMSSSISQKDGNTNANNKASKDGNRFESKQENPINDGQALSLTIEEQKSDKINDFHINELISTVATIPSFNNKSNIDNIAQHENEMQFPLFNKQSINIESTIEKDHSNPNIPYSDSNNITKQISDTSNNNYTLLLSSHNLINAPKNHSHGQHRLIKTPQEISSLSYESLPENNTSVESLALKDTINIDGHPIADEDISQSFLKKSIEITSNVHQKNSSQIDDTINYSRHNSDRNSYFIDSSSHQAEATEKNGSQHGNGIPFDFSYPENHNSSQDKVQNIAQFYELSKYLKDTTRDDIMRYARLIIRGQNQGEIRLTLQPAEMGTVRVRLQLEDSSIVGRFIVENNNVREIFEQNLPDLQRSFREQGIQVGNMDVSVTSDEKNQQHEYNDLSANTSGAYNMISQISFQFINDGSMLDIYA